MSLTPRIDKLDAGRNLLINGGLQVYQRGTSAVALDANDYWLADRWTGFMGVTAAVVNMSQDSATPLTADAGINLPYSIKFTATTGGAISGNQGAGFYQRIEGYDYQPYHGGQALTAQFWVRASKTGNMTVMFSDVTTRRYLTNVTINAANTWELKRINITTDTITGSWNFTNSTGLVFACMLAAAGTRLQTTADQWFNTAGANFAALTSQTNFFSTTNDYVQFAGLQLVPGTFTSQMPMAIRSYEEELARCQRYCYAHMPASVGGVSAAFGVGQCITTTQARAYIPFPVTMRGTPILHANTPAASTMAVTNAAGTTVAATARAISTTGSGPSGAVMVVDVASGLVAGNATEFRRNSETPRNLGETRTPRLRSSSTPSCKIKWRYLRGFHG